MTDPVNHPEHYTKGAIETIDIIETIVLGYDPVVAFNVGQVVKYLARAPYKGDLQLDLDKARWYLERAIDHAEDGVDCGDWVDKIVSEEQGREEV